MDSVQMYKFCVDDPHISKFFKGVYSRDRLPSFIDVKPCAIIVNTHPSSMPGEHWLAMYFDTKGRTEFFDPYGKAPNTFDMEKFLQTTSSSWSFNNKQIQAPHSLMCGPICLFYLFFRCRNFSLCSIQNFFSQDYENNEKMIRNFIDLFSEDL